jgi:hypothetical protein
MLRSSDVVFFTLGLTEAWRDQTSGRIYPLAPGVVADPGAGRVVEFANFDFSETKTAALQVVKLIRKHSPRARIVFTVSPVALVATGTKNHVLVANQYSKSVLRAVAQEVAMGDPLCDYFPSYEIVTNRFVGDEYLAPDRRGVNEAGVEAVMQTFLKAYPSISIVEDEGGEDPGAPSPRYSLICEEEMLETFA